MGGVLPGCCASSRDKGLATQRVQFEAVRLERGRSLASCMGGPQEPGGDRASFECVRVTNRAVDGCYLGNSISVRQSGYLPPSVATAVRPSQYLDVMCTYKICVFCIKSADSGMNWTPNSATQLHMEDRVYVGGNREGVEDFAHQVGELSDVKEETLKLTKIEVPTHWFGAQLGPQTEKRKNGLNLRYICGGASLLGLRNEDGSVHLFPGADMTFDRNQKMLFLHSLDSYPGDAFHFDIGSQLRNGASFKALQDQWQSPVKGFACAVCSESLDDRPQRTFSCGHMICSDCAADWLKAGRNTCPECRAVVEEHVRVGYRR